jgi:hypothetical protein
LVQRAQTDAEEPRSYYCRADLLLDDNPKHSIRMSALAPEPFVHFDSHILDQEFQTEEDDKKRNLGPQPSFKCAKKSSAWD